MNIDKLNVKIEALSKTRKGAIQGSILKWEFLIKAPKGIVLKDPPDCGLCLKYMTKTCRLCPLSKIKERCLGINENAWSRAFNTRETLRAKPTPANFRKWRKAAREMLRVLKTLK